MIGDQYVRIFFYAITNIYYNCLNVKKWANDDN